MRNKHLFSPKEILRAQRVIYKYRNKRWPFSDWAPDPGDVKFWRGVDPDSMPKPTTPKTGGTTPKIDGPDAMPNNSSRTTPSKEVNPSNTPRGESTRITDKMDESTKRSLTRENESASTLAKKGYDVEQNPTILDTTKNPDYVIEGQVFDNYAPSTNKPRNIASEIEGKVLSGQTERVVLNLNDSAVDLGALRTQFTDYPVAGLKEIIIIKGESVIDFFPF